MQRLHRLPSPFQRFSKIGGVLDFGVFDETDGTEAEIIEAVGATLGKVRRFDGERLIELGGRAIFEPALLGDWFDVESGTLIKRGDWRTADGRELQNPKLTSLGGVKIMSGASPIPEIGAGGQLAFAFTCPPYSLRAKPPEVQDLFDAIIAFLLPRGLQHEIRDWSRPALVEVSDYFEAGAEWWGIYLYTIRTPELRRLTVIAGSTTD